VQCSHAELPRGYIIKADDNCIGLKRTLHTGCGTLHCEAFFDPNNGQLLETYFSKGSSGGCNNFMIGLSRMISLASRGGVDIYSIIDQLNSCGTCPSYAVRSATKRDTSKGSCCPVAIGNALLDMYKAMQKEVEREDDEEIDSSSENYKKKEVVNPCPQCGEELSFEGGCNICKSCGWSKCG
jgi:ribonucleoside-diphosphate reductase alpha chain